MNFLKSKPARPLYVMAFCCFILLNATGCDLLELEEENNTTDTSLSDTSTDTGHANDTSDNDTSDNEYDYEREAAIVQFGWDKVEALSHHFCHLAMVCPERDPELVRELSRFITYEACIESGPWSLTIGDTADELTAVNAKRLHFNPAKTQECFQAIQDASTACDFDSFFLAEIHIGNACDEVFTPQQDDGEPCFNNIECFSGECLGNDSDPEVCEFGICADERPRPDIVGPAADCTHDICDNGLFCDTQHNVCKPVIVKELHESCDLSIGEVCEQDSVCLSALCQEPHIVSFKNKDEKCDDYVEFCKIGLTCNYISDEEPHRCMPVGTEGDFCERQQQCQTGFWCDHSEGTCAALSDIDEPCSEDEACPFGTFCDDWSDEPVCDYWPIDYNEEVCTL